MRGSMFKGAVLLGVMCVTQALGTAQAALDEKSARDLTSDFATAVSTATDMVGGMQTEINAGKADPAKIKPAAFLDVFGKKFEAAAGKPFDTKAAGLTGEYRAVLAKMIGDVIADNNKAITAGGQDAFVPAFFRAQVLLKFNKAMKGKMSGYATTHKKYLINGDSAVELILKGSPLLPDVAKLVSSEEASPVDKLISGRYMSYRPMKLKEACVACHARNGIAEHVGGYGGALVIDLKL